MKKKYKHIKELNVGIRIEMEHKGLAKKISIYEHKYHKLPSDKRVADWIAQTHLKEDKNYYPKLKKCRL